MVLNKIMAIVGHPESQKWIAPAAGGNYIVESLIDKKRIIAFKTMKVTTLDACEIYGKTDNMHVEDIFKKISKAAKGGEVDASDEEEQKKYLKKVFPDYDDARVHASDIKKLFSWYNLLQKNDLLKEEEVKEESKEGEEGKTKDVVKPAKAAAKKTSGGVKAGNKPLHVSSKGARKTTTVRKTGA